MNNRYFIAPSAAIYRTTTPGGYQVYIGGEWVPCTAGDLLPTAADEVTQAQAQAEIVEQSFWWTAADDLDAMARRTRRSQSTT